MAAVIEIADDQDDKYIEIVEKEINEKLSRAYSLAGLADDPSSDSDVKVLRKKAKFDARFRIDFNVYTFVVKGRSQGVPKTTSGDLPKHIANEKVEVIGLFAGKQKLRERVLTGNYRDADLRDSHVGAITRHCGGCNGHGVHNCGSCSGAGQISCSSCFYGKTSCLSCGGAGYHTSTHDSRVTATCNSCFGSGRTNCRYCGGSTTVTCTACRGGGEVRCGTCAATGLLTDITGVKSTIVCELIPGKSEFDIYGEQDAVFSWVKNGFKEAQKASHKWLPSTNAHSVPPVEQPSQSRFTSTFPIEIEATVIRVDGAQHGVSMQVNHLKLDKSWIRFTSFLDSAFNRVADFAKGLSHEAPSTFRSRLKEAYKETALALEYAYKGKDAVEDFGRKIESDSSGAISRFTAKKVASAYHSSIENFTKIAAKQTAVGPFLIAVAIWVITQLGGMPGIAQKHPEWFAPYVALPALLSWVAIRWSVKKAIKRETGRTDVGVIGYEALVLPAAVAVIFAMTAYLNINLIPTVIWDFLSKPPNR